MKAMGTGMNATLITICINLKSRKDDLFNIIKSLESYKFVDKKEKGDHSFIHLCELYRNLRFGYAEFRCNDFKKIGLHI